MIRNASLIQTSADSAPVRDSNRLSIRANNLNGDTGMYANPSEDMCTTTEADDVGQSRCVYDMCVRVRISVKRIIEINVIEQSFCSEFFLEACWVDIAACINR